MSTRSQDPKGYKPRPPEVGNDKTDEERRYASMTELAIKGGSQLRRKLNISEDSFSFIYGPNTANPKKYYLSGVLNEVEKAGMAMMYAADFVIDSRKVDLPDINDATGRRIANNSLQVRIDELAISERKLTESLVDVAGFRRADSEDYYRHYIVLHELADKRKIQNDFDEFYGIKNKNLALQITELEQQADALAAKLDATKCWYAKKKKGVLTRSISTFSERFKAVLPRMSEPEKATLQTYGTSFGMQSDLLHSGKPIDRDELTLDSLGGHIGRIGIFAAHVLNAIKDLGHIHNVKGILKTIADVTKKNDYPLKLFKQKTRPAIDKGDFVVTIWGDLGQVKKVITSRYGYRSFRMRYLDRLPMPGIPEDDFPGNDVRLVYKLKPAIEKMREEIRKVTPELNPSTRELNKLMAESILHFWNNVGLKEFTFNNPEAGYEKMQQELDRLKAKK